MDLVLPWRLLPLPRLRSRPDAPTPTEPLPGRNSLAAHVEWFRDSDLRYLTVPKRLAPELPDEFSRSRLAVRREGAVASYRDDRRTDSVHVVEYPDRWELHVDRFNPRYLPLLHVAVDAPEQTAEAVESAVNPLGLPVLPGGRNARVRPLRRRTDDEPATADGTGGDETGKEDGSTTDE
jgi:hypothetical protein